MREGANTCAGSGLLCAEPLQALGGLLLKEMGYPICFCLKEQMKSTICTSCASILHIMLVMLKLHHLCRTLVLCQKEGAPSVLTLGTLKATEAK